MDKNSEKCTGSPGFQKEVKSVAARAVDGSDNLVESESKMALPVPGENVAGPYDNKGAGEKMQGKTAQKEAVRVAVNNELLENQVCNEVTANSEDNTTTTTAAAAGASCPMSTDTLLTLNKHFDEMHRYALMQRHKERFHYCVSAVSRSIQEKGVSELIQMRSRLGGGVRTTDLNSPATSQEGAAAGATNKTAGIPKNVGTAVVAGLANKPKVSSSESDELVEETEENGKLSIIVDSTEDEED